MTDLELDVWDAWLRERQEHLEETLSNISPSEEPCRYYLLTGYIQGMLEALTMLTTVEDGKRFKIKLEQFRQNLLLSGDYDATGNYKQAVKTGFRGNLHHTFQQKIGKRGEDAIHLFFFAESGDPVRIGDDLHGWYVSS